MSFKAMQKGHSELEILRMHVLQTLLPQVRHATNLHESRVVSKHNKHSTICACYPICLLLLDNLSIM